MPIFAFSPPSSPPSPFFPLSNVSPFERFLFFSRGAARYVPSLNPSAIPFLPPPCQQTFPPPPFHVRAHFSPHKALPQVCALFLCSSGTVFSFFWCFVARLQMLLSQSGLPSSFMALEYVFPPLWYGMFTDTFSFFSKLLEG